MLKTCSSSRSIPAALLLLLAVPGVRAAKFTKPPKDTPQLRAEYLARLAEQNLPPPDRRSIGSLWVPGSTLGDLSADYKARNLNDTITIVVGVQTTAAQSGTSDSERTFSANSGITGLAGDIATRGLNPLFNANSASALKGQGSTSTNTTFQTSMTGQVIAVLPNGNLVVEAQRQIFMNNQHEDVVVRGVVRPGDVSPSNMVASSSLANLEIEMKGKGIISDGVRPLNPITRTILWLFGF
jgi:flagellar L-ring protein precursor FlgH